MRAVSYAALLLVLLPAAAATLPTASSRADASPRRLRANGNPAPVHITSAGARVPLVLTAIAGCEYRVRARGGTLARPTLHFFRHGEELPSFEVDAGPDSSIAQRVWQALADERWRVEVGGFSASSGTATVTYETLGPGGARIHAHRRVLTARDATARVGALFIGEDNIWSLALSAGKAYEIVPNRGSAGRVRLQVIDDAERVIADSETGALHVQAYPPVRFRAPDPLPPHGLLDPKGPSGLRLRVRGLFDGGGSYGVRLRRLDDDIDIDPAPAPLPEPPAGELLASTPWVKFRAGPGDLALLHLPTQSDNPHYVQMQRGNQWVRTETLGEVRRARSHHQSGLMWFRPYYGGTYRFVGVRGPTATEFTLLRRERLAGAPLLLGTGEDPQVSLRLRGGWQLAGVGGCMPGWDYLFALTGAPNRGVAMRVVGPEGKSVATRSAFGGMSYSPGYGPTLRFRAKRAGMYRLEAKSRKTVTVRALLRHAESNR